VKLTAVGTANGVANDPPQGEIRPFVVRVATGGQAWDLRVPRDSGFHRRSITGLPAGEYSVTLECPRTQRGSYGAPLAPIEARRAEGTTEMTLLVELIRD
jgi:hypothetical protein